MAETHPFKYYLPPDADKLIIGSFPCFNGTDYGDWFYSGSGKSDFWRLISEVFGLPANTRQEKEQLCMQNGIAITDIAYKVTRKKGNCSDSNLEIIEANTTYMAKCLDTGIQKIFFTSKFVENFFLKNFLHTLIPSTVLISPSPAANRYIGGLEEYKKLKEAGKITTPYTFRLMKYKEAFEKE